MVISNIKSYVYHTVTMMDMYACCGLPVNLFLI